MNLPRLFTFALASSIAVLSIGFAQDPSQTDATKAGPDFALQGEYEGSATLNSGSKKFGAQVIAKGDGKFMIKVHTGGLPGQTGFDPSVKPMLLNAVTKDGKVEIMGKDISGTIQNGKLTIKDNMKLDLAMAKVERTSPTIGKAAPEGAVILFDGKNADEWSNGKLVEGNLLNNGITTKKKFTNFTLHMEFRLPYMPKASGQGRGNSGLYLQDRYEVQILDSFGLEGKNNECGGIYTQYEPSVNACFPPLVWQTYDINYVAAKFDESGKKIAPAEATIFHNGIKIHDKIQFKGSTGGGKPETKEAGAFQLQNHGNPVYFRNIWVLESK